MSLKIITIQHHGDAKEEYILLQATEEVNLHAFAIVDRTLDSEGKVSDVFKHFFRFPNKTVKKGEYVSLRTHKGDYKLGTLTDGSPVHRFYWGSEAAIWNNAGSDRAEVLKVSTVDAKEVVRSKKRQLRIKK